MMLKHPVRFGGGERGVLVGDATLPTRYFAGQGGSARALGDAVVVEAARPGGVARWWQGVRERVGERVRAALPGAVGAIAATLLTGEQGAIPAADRAAFRDSGLAHLLAVAGLHIGIVMGLAFGLVRRALALSERAVTSPHRVIRAKC